ncbi:helix-turn-helix transcriptional regulator [Streptomyces sp. NPDC058284]|uniref:helix-turn-helix transcriptional regulator n=1 Tax=unclassified Streptomyces TaxID=2593676 RepID=UPI003664A111
MVSENRGWMFLTNHARVLLAIAHDPAVQLRQIAASCRITERTAQAIVADLEEAGYLHRQRVGRRNRYTLHLDKPFRHPAYAGLPARALLNIFADQPADTGPPAD